MTRYRERVWPSAWVFVVGLILVPTIIIVFAPLNIVVGVILGVAVYLGYVAILVASSPVIEVSNDRLQVGSARVPLDFTGAVTPYSSREHARAAAGPNLDARAWLCIRGWVSTSARIDINDANDPVPYWLFSTRHPEAVRAAVDAAKAAQAAR